jgi:hypothetical protein
MMAFPKKKLVEFEGEGALKQTSILSRISGVFFIAN